MVIFRLLELVMAFLALWFIMSQVLLPAVRGTILFPWFRTSERELRSTLVEQNQEFVEQKLEQAIAENDAALNPSTDTEGPKEVTPQKEAV